MRVDRRVPGRIFSIFAKLWGRGDGRPRRAHNSKIAGSNPAPATTIRSPDTDGVLLVESPMMVNFGGVHAEVEST